MIFVTYQMQTPSGYWVPGSGREDPNVLIAWYEKVMRKPWPELYAAGYRVLKKTVNNETSDRPRYEVLT